MSGYRFCRSDDLPVLVEAYNACWLPHFPGEPAFTVEAFKRGARELNLWASSCMLAFEGDLVVGCLIGAKRDGEANLVHRVAIRPGHERRGHGRHLVTSLAQKVAILGPPRLLAEVPAKWTGACRFLERCGFRPEASYADLVLSSSPREGASPLASPATLEDLLENGALDVTIPRSWERSLATLRNRSGQLEGLAIASEVRIEAHLLHRLDPASGAREIVAIGAAPEGPGPTLLRALVSSLPAGERRATRIPKIHDAELGAATLAELGFQVERAHVGYAFGAM